MESCLIHTGMQAWREVVGSWAADWQLAESLPATVNRGQLVDGGCLCIVCSHRSCCSENCKCHGCRNSEHRRTLYGGALRADPEL
jgi:hypothetical protein